MKVNLTVIEGPEKGKSFTFDEPENFLLGRSAQASKAHLCLSPDDTYVSRNHFLLEINPPDCFIRDAGSLNGTFIVRHSDKTVFYISGRSDDKEYYGLIDFSVNPNTPLKAKHILSFSQAKCQESF